MTVWRGIFRAMAITPLLITLSACSSAGDMAAARHAVEMFHYELDNANYDAIWKDTASEMRAAATQPVLNQLLSAVHTKLGKVTASQEQGINVNYNTGATFTTVVMHTRFDHGAGDENFVFKTAEGSAHLVGYHINSMDLITK
jgi:hypothetical protein